MNKQTDVVKAIARLAMFYKHESQWVATIVRRLAQRTTARESATQAQTACAPTASRTWTAPHGSSAATGSARSPAMATQLRNQQLHQPQPQLLQNQQLPPTHPALRSAAQTTTVRTEHAKTETVCPIPLPQSQAQLL